VNALFKEILLTIVVALLAWIFFFNGGAFLEQQVAPALAPVIAPALGAKPAERVTPIPTLPPAISAFKQAYAEQLLSYTDAQYGFTIQYPVGYYAVLDPEPGVRLRFAAFAPGYSAEFIDFLVLNESSARVEFEKAVGDYSSGELVRSRSLVVGVKNVSVIEGVVENPLLPEKLFLTQAFFDCVTRDGVPFVLVLNAVVPQEFAQDKDLVNYVINTVKC